MGITKDLYERLERIIHRVKYVDQSSGIGWQY